MLNPSTADAEQDDATVRRVRRFSAAWGYGDVVIVNLFAFRARDPLVLRTVRDPIGPENLETLMRWFARASAEGSDAELVAAWGARAGEVDDPWRARMHGVLSRAGARCLGLTRDGHPRHPLYVPASAARQPLPEERSRG